MKCSSKKRKSLFFYIQHILYMLGLGTGGASQDPVYWIRTVHWCRGEAAWSRRSRDHRPPPAGEGAPPEALFYAIWRH